MLVGHVTKEGQIAGPRVVEHMVDTVLYFEGERGHQFRILRSVKNRFGPADEIGVFEMTGAGLPRSRTPRRPVPVRRGETPAPGSVVFAGIEGTRPLLVEFQALWPLPTPQPAAPRGGGLGRRAAGHDPRRARGALRHPLRRARRLSQRRRRHAHLGTRRRSRRGRGAPLRARGRPARRNRGFRRAVSLSGALRPVTQAENRLKDKLGFSAAILPKGCRPSGSRPTWCR
jgi:DNA repair protein RadA/Sms